MEPLDARTSASRTGGPSFSFRNRLARVLWQTCWLLLARWTPPPLHGWRAMLLSLFGASLGRGCRVHASVKVWHPAHLVLGDNVLIGPRANLYNQGRITIGSDSIVSQGAHVCASSHDVSDPHFQLVVRPVTIGPNCWIAAEAFVGPGVTMAEGAVLAARGALFENGDSWTIYRGNPAAAVKPRVLRSGAV